MWCTEWDWIIFSKDVKRENILKLLKLGCNLAISDTKQNKNHRHKSFNPSASVLEIESIGMKALASKDTHAVTSAVTLYLKNVSLFQCNWYIREHFEHNMNFALAYVQFPLQEILRDGRKLHPAESSSLGKHKTQTPHTSPATSVFCVCVWGATSIHIWC